MTKKQFLQELKTFSAVVFFTFVYGFGVIWFLEQTSPPLFTGGIPGLAQLFRSILMTYFDLDPGDIFLGIFVFLVNVPIIILGWFGVSKKFTLYSLVSVVIQSTVMGFISRDNFGITQGLDVFSLAVIGGIVTGIGIGGALRFGSSTGGIDIIAQYFSLKKGISVGYISLILNAIIAIGGGLVLKSGAIAAYTTIRIIITTLVTDKIHTAYNFMKVEIITNYSEQLIEEILVNLHRGVTLLDVKGGYKKTERTMVVVAISTYELGALKQIVYQRDPNAFMLAQPVRYIFGNFQKKTIV
ncbi:MAG: YitT family protein [Acholeplasmataceae bacterium]|jgi:uncharacterized membrane-anchored protein YitT (DUF2179 family)|nr:YitT family protein [Acholeplasmataceae bacterium]